MRVLIVTQKVDSTDDNLGFFHRWIEEFAKHNTSITTICLYEGEHHLPENVRVLSLGKEHGVSRLKYIKRFFAYIWRERKNYDAVFVHMNQIYVILGGLFWRLCKKKIGLWYTHGSVSFSLLVATFLAHVVFTASDKSFRITSKKKQIVGHGIDIDLFKPSIEKRDTDACTIVSVGRIAPVKKLEVLIRALPLVLAQKPNAHLCLYGLPQDAQEKQYQNQLFTLVHTLGLQDKVIFGGGVLYTDLPKVLGNADIFVQASQTGSVDKSVLEALAMNIPVVSTNGAFKAFPGVVYVGMSTKEIARALVSGHQGGDVRDYIVQNHSLQGLIKKISNVLN